MKTFNSMRRDFLRTGGIGMAAAAIPTVSFAASHSKRNSGRAGAGIFDVRAYGATGTAKRLTRQASTTRLKRLRLGRRGGSVSCRIVSVLLNSPQEPGSSALAAGQRDRRSRLAIGRPADRLQRRSLRPPSPMHRGKLSRITAITIGITPCCGRRTSRPEHYGPGLIWGRGLSNGRSLKDYGAPFTASRPGGNKAIALKNCHNVLLRDFSILKAATLACCLRAWTI